MTPVARTPVEAILGQHPVFDNLPSAAPTTEERWLAPVPEPASAAKLATLRDAHRAVLADIARAESNLAQLAEAQERARNEWRAASAAVSAAETALAEARLFSRTSLAAAYINKEAMAGPTVVEAELATCTRQQTKVEEIERVLREERAAVEAELKDHHQRRAQAAGALLSRCA